MYIVKREKRRVFGRFGAVTGVLLVLTLVLSGCDSLLGSSDNDDEETYAVTVSPSGAESDESVSPDVSEAAEGETVTLTASLNSGREVKLSTDASGVTIDPITITTDGGTATFTMPATDVMVNATFSTQVPDNVPEASEGAITGDAYGSMRFTDGIQTDPGGAYGTDINLYSANPADVATYDYLTVASIYDTTDSADIEPGTYSYVANGEGNSNWGTDGTFDGLGVFINFNGDLSNPTADYAASFSTQTADLTDSFDLITDGTITVSKDGEIYTIEWEMTTDGGETLAGSYTGAVDGVDQEE